MHLIAFQIKLDKLKPGKSQTIIVSKLLKYTHEKMMKIEIKKPLSRRHHKVTNNA